MLRQFLDFLRHEGVIRSKTGAPRRRSPVEQATQAFETYLRNERVLAEATVTHYVTFVREFLADQFGRGRVTLARLCAGDVVRFVQRQASRLHLKRAKQLTTALWAFLHYARYRGAITRALVTAVPSVANWSMPSIPRAIPAESVRQLLASINRQTAKGCRDYAILLLLARLGLRASEVAFLELGDLDWEGGQVTVRGKRFVVFMEEHRASIITTRLALAWAQQPQTVQPAEWARRLSTVRIFARYRHATDPRTEIPPDGLLPYRPKRARPYLYSDAEIRDLLHAALHMSCRYERGKLRPWVYYCLFGLLSVSGLRLGEARNLELHDVDLTSGVLTIRGAKFGKTRLVPLHASACKVLAEYISRRQCHWGQRSVSSYVFVSSGGHRLDNADIHRTFYALSRQIGLRGHADSHGPRIHDLRHRFAGKTLWRWYRTGEDPERRLPILSAYLGHVHVGDTYWYLSVWPELMREAMRHLERRWEDRP